MYIMIKLIFVLSTIYIILILINYLTLGKENDISKIFKDFNALDKNKKIIFITSFCIFWPFYMLSYIFKCFFAIQISFIVTLSMSLSVKIEKKMKKWNSCNYSYCNLKISKLIKIIFTDGYINSYNTAFTNIYNLFSYNKKKDYKSILNNFAFLKSTGVSLHYLNFILNFVTKYKSERINKKLKIKVIIKIRRILNAIIMIINLNFREETSECGMRIIIQDFKIRTNNDKIHFAESIIKKNKSAWFIAGRYIDSSNPKRVPHVYMMNTNGDKWGLTSSKCVKIWNSNCSIKTNECGLQPKGKTQYAVQFVEGEGFENRFETHNDLTWKIVKDYDIKYRDEFTGAEMQKSILISSQNATEAIVKGQIITKMDKKMEKTINLTPEQVDIIKKFSNKEMGIMSKKNMSDQDLFDSQKRFYGAVIKPQSKDDYYYGE